MTIYQNEKGSVLILVLLLSIVATMICIPLFMHINQGRLIAMKDANMEQANSDSESGIKFFRRIVMEAVNSGLTLDEQELDHIVAQINDAGMQVDRGGFPTLTLVKDEHDVPIAIRATATKGNSSYQQSRTIERAFTFNANGGTGGSGGSGNEWLKGAGAFFNFGVATNNITNGDNQQNRYFRACQQPGESPDPTQDEYEGIIAETLDWAQVNMDFEEFVDSQIASRETSIDPISLTAAEWDDLYNIPSTAVIDAGNVVWDDIDGNGTIRLDELYKTIVIEGDIQSSGDIIFENYVQNLTVNGNVLAAGNIIFNNGIGKLTISGSMKAGSAVTFKGIQQVHIGEDLISGGNMSFGSISGTGLVIEGHVLTHGHVSFATISGNGLTVKGHFSSLNSITFAGISTLRIGEGNGTTIPSGGSLIAGNVLTFQGRAGVVQIDGDMRASVLSVQAQIADLTLGGSLITNGTLSLYSTVDPWTIHGNMSVGGSFYSASTKRLFVGGSIYVHDHFHLGYNPNTGQTGTDVDRIEVGGSIYAGGYVEFSGILNHLIIDGSLMTKQRMSFKNVINITFHINGAMGAIGQVKFDNHIWADSTVGGYYSGGGTTFQNWANIGVDNKGICVTGGNGGDQSGADIEFGDWHAR